MKNINVILNVFFINIILFSKPQKLNEQFNINNSNRTLKNLFRSLLGKNR